MHSTNTFAAMLHAYILALPRFARRSCSARQILYPIRWTLSRAQTQFPLSPLYNCWSIAKWLQPRTPPQVVTSAKQFDIRVGHLTREPTFSAVKKNLLQTVHICSCFPLQLPAELADSLSGFDSDVGINPLAGRTHMYWVGKHHEIAHWILMASALALANFKTNFGISKYNLIPSPRGPESTTSGHSQLWRLTTTNCICFTLSLSENTIVTGTCWISSARPLSTITLVVHPGSENHELVNNHLNHELAITWFYTTALVRRLRVKNTRSRVLRPLQ